MTTPHPAAIRAVKKINAGCYTEDTTALIITREYEPVVSALQPFVKYYKRLSDGRSHVPKTGILFGLDMGTDKEAEITIEDFKRAIEALNQLTTPTKEDK